jgi:hypothetical protein
MLIEHYPSHLN